MTCKHYQAYISPSDLIGRAQCPDCGEQVMAYEVINGLMDKLRELIKEAENARTT